MTLKNEKHDEIREVKNESPIDKPTESKDENNNNKSSVKSSENAKENVNENLKDKNTTNNTNKIPEASQKKNNCEECQKNKKNLVNALKHIKTLQGNSTKLLEYYEKVKKEKISLEENVKKSQAETTKLQEVIKANKTEKAKLNELLTKFQNEVSELKKNNNDTQTSKADERIIEENKKLKENYEKSIIDFKNLENKLKLSQKEIEKYKIDFSNYRDQAKNQQRINKDKINIYEKELKDFKEIKADYEKELKKNKVLNEKINQLENTINELKTNESRNKVSNSEENKSANKEMELKLWKLNNTVSELEQKHMQMELEKNLLFQENLRLSDKLKKMTDLQIGNIGEDDKINSNQYLSSEAQSEKLKEKDKIIESEKEKSEKLKKELNEKMDQLNIYKRLIEKKTKEIRTLNKENNSLEERCTELKNKKTKLENSFDEKLEKIKTQYQDEINSYKSILKHKEELHEKEKLSLFGIITRQQVEIDDIKNNHNIIKEENIDVNNSMTIYESDTLHESFENDKIKTSKYNKRINDDIENDQFSKSKKAKYEESTKKSAKQASSKDKEKENHKKKKEDNIKYTPTDNDFNNSLFDDSDLNDTLKKEDPIEGEEDINDDESSESNSTKREFTSYDETNNSGQSINDTSSQDKKTETPISPTHKKRLKAIISIKKRVSNKKYIDTILENKEKNNILEIILNKSVDINDLKHRIPVFEQFSENVNTVMQCLKQHWHKYSSSSTMSNPPQMYVPQMWEKNDITDSIIKKQKNKENEKESSYDQSYGNEEFIIRLPVYLPYPEKQALFLIWMLYHYAGKKFIDTILSTLSNDIALIKHSTKDYPYLCCITRAYILLCKNLNDYERARIFCFDLLRESSHGSEIMIHIFANIAKAWPFLLNYSGLLENSKSKSSDSFADDKLNTYKIFSDEPHSVINNNKDAASSPSDEANELTLNNTDLEKSDSSKLKRKVRLVVRLFYQSFEVIICWLYLNMCMERKIDLNHVSVKYLYTIFMKEWNWKQPEASTADLASFIQKLLNLLEDKDIVDCIKNIDLLNLTPQQPVHKQKDILASIIRIHLLKSFELICSCFEWSYCHNYVIKVHLWKLLDSDISGYIIELIGKISRSKLTKITEPREGLDTWRSNFSQALISEQTPLYVQISLVKSIFDIFQGQVEELKPVILWYNKLNSETKKLISPSLLYEIETYKKQYEKELKTLNLN